MESRYVPLWKAIESPIISLDESYVELFSLLFVFLLTLVAMASWQRRRQLVRHAVQTLSIAVFFFFVYSCLGVFGMIRNLIHGTTLIGTVYTEAFFWMSLPLIVVSFTLTTGPYFCGWICPTGTFQELAAWLSGKTGTLLQRVLPASDRQRRRLAITLAALALAGLVAGAVGLGRSRQLYIEDASLIWAVAILVLVLVLRLCPRSDGAARRIRRWSFLVIVASALLKTTIVSPVHFAFANIYDPSSALTTLVLIAASFFVSRAWCRYVCPWGYLLGWLHRFSRLHLARTAACSGCNSCDAVCRAGAIHGGNVLASSCQFCLACADHCPRRALRVVDG